MFFKKKSDSKLVLPKSKSSRFIDSNGEPLLLKHLETTKRFSVEFRDMILASAWIKLDLESNENFKNIERNITTNLEPSLKGDKNGKTIFIDVRTVRAPIDEAKWSDDDIFKLRHYISEHGGGYLALASVSLMPISEDCFFGKYLGLDLII